MRTLLLGTVTLLLASCTAGDRGERWNVEVLPGTLEAYAATFSEDGKKLTALANQGGRLHVVEYDLTAKTRGAKNLGEVPNVPGATVFDARHIDLAARPGTTELWAFISGTVVRFPPGSAAWTSFGNPVAASGAAGGLAFVDKNTLIVTSIEGDTVRVAIQGDKLGTPEVLDVGRHFQVLVVDGQAWFGTADTGPATLELGTLKNVFKSGAGLVAGPLAASGDRALHLSEMGYCVRPRDKQTGGVVPQPNGSGNTYGSTCGEIHFDARFELPRATMSPDAKSVALVSDRGVVLLEESAPPNRSEDAEGTWCTWAHASHVSKSLTIDLGVMTLTGLEKPYFDANFEKTMLEGSGQLRSIHRVNPKPEIADTKVRSAYETWVKRSGDTLVLAGPISSEQAKELFAAGFFDHTGVYLKSADGTCP